MSQRPPKLVLATVSNRDMSALRAYWTVFDLSQGPRETHFWDLRYGMVNRWQAEDVHPRHIRYGLLFRRADGVDDLEYAAERGVFPKSPTAWKILFEAGTFPMEFNPEHDEWMRANSETLERIENRDGVPAAWAYVRQHAPPEHLLNPENWEPDQARTELFEVLPKALELYTSERPPIDWRPKGSIVSPPDAG